MGLDDKENLMEIYKCIVLECKDSFLHVLTDDGDHIRIKNKENSKIGDRIYVFEDDIIKEDIKILNINRKLRYISSIAALFIIFFVASLSITNTGYAVISLDINPSIQMEINKSGKVLKMITFNEEAKDLLSKLNLKGVSYEKAIDQILDEAVIRGYKVDNHSVLIAVAPKKVDSKSNEIINSIETNIRTYKESIDAEVRVGTYKEDSDVSLGRSILLEEYPDYDDDKMKNEKIDEIFNHIEEDDYEEDYREELKEKEHDEEEELEKEKEDRKKEDRKKEKEDKKDHLESIEEKEKNMQEEKEEELEKEKEDRKKEEEDKNDHLESIEEKEKNMQEEKEEELEKEKEDRKKEEEDKKDHLESIEEKEKNMQEKEKEIEKEKRNEEEEDEEYEDKEEYDGDKNEDD